MRIGISASVIQRGKGGVGQYLFALVRAFVPHTREHRFTLFVLEEDLSLFEWAHETMELVSVPERYRAPIRNILWHQTILPLEVRRRNLDVVHIPSYRRMLWPRPCPRVATIHDLAPFQVAEKYDRLRMLYGRHVARLLARRQEELIAVSENTASDIVRFFGIGRNRLTVIHNGVEHERFSPGDRALAQDEAARLHGLKRPFFLYVARLEHPAKNHVRLIAAFEQFKARTNSPWQLVLGGGDWHGADAIHAAIENSPSHGDIRCLGFIPDAMLPGLYRAAEAFVYPSLYEGFGMPPTEAMACGCPVICSSRGALGEVVGTAALLIEPEAIASMAEALGLLAADAVLRQRMRTAGLARARRFDWKQTAEQTLQVYRRAAVRAACS